MLRRMRVLSFLWLAMSATTFSQAQNVRPDQLTFRALYKELVETNTTASTGSCTLAAQRMAAHLKASGYSDDDLTLFAVPASPKDGGLVAILRGSDLSAKPILLLAHLDVVEAKREDWTRDPFSLIEENGYFYARGASDDKVLAAIFIDSMIRFYSERRPRRTVKLALTCGEETSGVFNGADWLAHNRRQLIDAEFALNEGASGRVDAAGKPISLELQVSEKTAHDYTLLARNPGGHSSLPRPDNAIYDLAAALGKIRAYTFPVRVDDTTRAFWQQTAKIVSPELSRAMNAIAVDSNNQRAAALLSREPLYNATLRTTCVATLLSAGHAENALPQRATANINCRIFPGETIDGTQQRLIQITGNPALIFTSKDEPGPPSHPTPLREAIIGPATTLAAEMYPGVPLIPNMSTQASDSIYLAAVGIPAYGIPGILYEADGGGIHGLNEHIRVKSVYDGRDYIHRLIRLYAEAPMRTP